MRRFGNEVLVRLAKRSDDDKQARDKDREHTTNRHRCRFRLGCARSGMLKQSVC